MDQINCEICSVQQDTLGLHEVTVTFLKQVAMKISVKAADGQIVDDEFCRDEVSKQLPQRFRDRDLNFVRLFVGLLISLQYYPIVTFRTDSHHSHEKDL